MGAGSILGGLSAGALANKLSLKSVPIMITSCGACLLIIAAAFTFSFPLMITYVITMIATFLMMVFATFISIQLMSQLQILTPTYLLGKIISCTMCISMCASPIGQAIYGVLFQRFSDNPEYIFTGSCIAVIMVALLSKKTFQDLQKLVTSKVSLMPTENL